MIEMFLCLVRPVGSSDRPTLSYTVRLVRASRREVA
jgi:hypothetical protein